MSVVSVKNDDGREKVRTQAQQLKRHPFWRLICRHIDSLVAEENGAIMQVGGDNEKLYTKRDLSIQHVNDLNDLKGLPDTVLSELEGTEGGKVEEHDPYVDPSAEPTA